MFSKKSNNTSEASGFSPLIPLKGSVLFPNLILPLHVSRTHSINAINYSLNHQIAIVAVSQRRPVDDDEVTMESLHSVGVLINVAHVMKISDEEMRVILDTSDRVAISEIRSDIKDGILMAKYSTLGDLPIKTPQYKLDAMKKLIIRSLDEYYSLSGSAMKDSNTDFEQIKNIGLFADIVASGLPNNSEYGQEILETFDLEKRLDLIHSCIMREVSILTFETGLQAKVKSNLSKYQKEHYLKEQISVLRKELGKIDGDVASGTEKYEALLEALDVAGPIKEKISEEIKRLQSLSSYSSEGSVIKGYLDTVFGLPWGKFFREDIGVQRAREILDQHHYGMEKIKDRIVDYIGVQSRLEKPKGAILCFYGPPGVGKTSLVKSIAEAMGRKYEKVALGGMRDEAEIRGHRKTYVGAFSGKIISAIKKAGSMNPVILLDEVDKLGESHRGDPASALLEVLDAEQNHAFQDNYLEFDFDLSNIVFIATANSLDIHYALLDRFDTIKLSGYTENEKLVISQNHLIPKSLEENGVKEGELEFSDGAIIDMVRYYTREAGVRGLGRQISIVARKALHKILDSEARLSSKAESETTHCSGGEKIGREFEYDRHTSVYINTCHDFDPTGTNIDAPTLPIQIHPGALKSYLGIKEQDFGVSGETDEVGVITGLAYTNFGGDLLPIEVVRIKGGKGEVKTTGKLGEVMKESVQTAFSYIQAYSKEYDIDVEEMQKYNLHIHFPEGAVPKDGPSAGCAITVAIISTFSERKISREFAVTGEVTLHGHSIPIGGLKEKLMSAARGGIKQVIIPKKNSKDLEEVPEEIKQKLNIHLVSQVKEVANLVLL